MDRAKEKSARFSILAINNRHSAVTQGSINRQDAHGSMLNKTERKENAANNADNHTYQPVASAFRQNRNRRDRDCDLKHRNSARENFMLVKVLFSFPFLLARFFLNF